MSIIHNLTPNSLTKALWVTDYKLIFKENLSNVSYSILYEMSIGFESIPESEKHCSFWDVMLKLWYLSNFKFKLLYCQMFWINFDFLRNGTPGL